MFALFVPSLWLNKLDPLSDCIQGCRKTSMSKALFTSNTGVAIGKGVWRTASSSFYSEQDLQLAKTPIEMQGFMAKFNLLIYS